MKKYILGAILSIGLLVSPIFVSPVEAAGLTSQQISSILGLLQSFGADQSVINRVSITLNHGSFTPSPYPDGCFSYSGFSSTTGNACDGSTPTTTTIPTVSSVNPESVQVGSTLTVYFTNGGSNGSVMLKTLDGSKSWFVPYTTGTVYNGFVYYDGSEVTFTVPSTIGAGQLPENSGYEAPIAITSGTYNLFVYSSGVSSTVFPITINTPSPTTTASSGLTSTQIHSLQSLLSSFGASSAAIANVNTILYGGTVPTSNLAPSGLTSSQIQSVLDLLSAFGANSTIIANVNTVLSVANAVPTAPTLTTDKTSGLPSDSFTLNWGGSNNTPTEYRMIVTGAFNSGDTLSQANRTSFTFGGSTSLSAFGLGAGTYNFTIRACNASGCSGDSNVVTYVASVANAVPTCSDPVAYYYYYASDVKAAGMDALTHWNTYGYKEGRKSCWPAPSLVGGANLMASALGALNSATQANVAQPATNPGFSYSWNNNLEIGSSYTADVSALQTALTREGVYTGEISGGFYNQTFSAVKAFQQKYGIDTGTNGAGFVGLKTRVKLNTLY